MIDLSRWNLTIPAGAQVIPTAKLVDGYSDQYFEPTQAYTDFIAPSAGQGIKSTPNSDYPRSELRQTLPSGADKQANWKAADGVHTLEGSLCIKELPASGKLIFAQIHGDGTHKPFALQITGQTLYAQIRKQLNGAEYKQALVNGYHLDTDFTYKIQVSEAGAVSVWINDLLLVDDYLFDMTSYAADTWYWKAGCYSQEPVGGKGVGHVRYYALAQSVTAPVVEKPTLGKQLDDLVIAYLAVSAADKAAKAQALIEAKQRLVAISTLIKSVPDAATRYELNQQAKTIQAQLK